MRKPKPLPEFIGRKAYDITEFCHVRRISSGAVLRAAQARTRPRRDGGARPRQHHRRKRGALAPAPYETCSSAGGRALDVVVIKLR
jgi:hypothetical protein